MADIKLKHYVIRKGKHGYWLPTPKMREMGFRIVPCGHDGPDAWAIAKQWEDRYQLARRGIEPAPKKVYPSGSVGDGFERFRRSETWRKKKLRTREDWERGWAYIEPLFGDVAPDTITFEMLDKWYARIQASKGDGEAGRAMKTWRALFNVLAAMKFCKPKADPSLAIRKASVPGRKATWLEKEVVWLVKDAWRQGYRGLACIVAIAWDTSFSPVDVRTLTSDHAVAVGSGFAFLVGRGKTDEPALGTLSRRTQRLIRAYIDSLDYDLHPDAPIFRTKGYAPSGKGGRPRQPAPYTKDSLIDDFADTRRRVFGKDEKRRLMDMRRSGAVEARAGGASIEHLAAKMANGIDQNRELQKVYLPVDVASVTSVDEARKKGRAKISADQIGLKKLDLNGLRTQAK